MTPTITEHERAQLRTRAVKIHMDPRLNFVVVESSHLIDLLDAADRDANYAEYIQTAVNESCSCGGGGEDDACGACRVYHYLGLGDA